MPLTSLPLTVAAARGELTRRLAEPAPGRIVLVTGPPMSGKTSVLRAAVDAFGDRVVHLSAAASPSPRRALDEAWRHAEALAAGGTPALLAADDVQRVRGWAARVEGLWRRTCARGVPLHVVLAGFDVSPPAALARWSEQATWLDRLTLRPWDAVALVEAGLAARDEAAERAAAGRSHPMAADVAEAAWPLVVRERLVRAALERDLPAVADIRRPAVLSGLLDACIRHATAEVTLEGLMLASGAPTTLETAWRHLQLLRDAELLAALPAHEPGEEGLLRAAYRVLLFDNALFWALPRANCQDGAPAPFDVLVRNACLSHAWRSGQRLTWWREQALQVDALMEGDWGRWIVRVQPGPVEPGEVDGLLACCEHYPEYEPVLVGDEAARAAARRAEIEWVDWRAWLTATPGVERHEV